MKLLKKFILSILTIILADLMIGLIICCTIQSVLVDNFLELSIRNKVEVIPYKEPKYNENDVNEELIKELMENEEIQKLMNQFIDEIIDELIDENGNEKELDELQLEKEVIKYIKENKEAIEEATGYEITDEAIEEASKKLNSEDNKKIIEQTIKNTKNSLTEEEKKALKLYRFFTSNKFKLILIISILIDTLLIIVLQKSLYLWIKNIAEAITISGLGIITLCGASKLVLAYTMQVENLNISSMLNIGIIQGIIGLILLIMYKVFEKIMKEDEKNAVSKVLK